MIGSSIVTSDQMQEEEKAALASDYMDKVAQGLVNSVLEERVFSVAVVVGKGNNGGVSAALARLLLEEGLDVDLICIFPKENSSELLQKHIQIFAKQKPPIFVEDPSTYTFEKELVIDALLGTGFKGAPEGKMLEAIKMINRVKECGTLVWSIDIPSGLDGALGVEAQTSAIVKADQTYFLGAAKKGFFLGKAFNYVGELKRIDFGLDINKKTPFRLLEVRDAIELLPKISRDRNKFDAGGVLGVVNSLEMSGAANLSSLGAFRSGAGYLRLCVPSASNASHTGSYPNEAFALGAHFISEAVKVPYSAERPRFLKEIIEASFKMKAAFIGPGFSTDKKARFS